MLRTLLRAAPLSALLLSSLACSSSSGDEAAPSGAAGSGTGGSGGVASGGSGGGGTAGSTGGTGGSAGSGGEAGGSSGRGGAAGGMNPADLDVQTSDGPIHGSFSSAGARVFKGIPFAAPPIGDNRFRPPQKVVPWTTPRMTTAFGGACSQVVLTNGKFDPSSGEDCLYLNVFTPDPPPKTPAPTMVWIHGGAFVFGSAAQGVYDASRLAQTTGSVVVTVNYRLGAMGFLAHPDLSAENAASPANAALEDQRAALRWVQTNIATFGGDAGNVTLFGESAGAISVGLHLMSPTSAGLFHKAIAESIALADGHLATIDEAKTMAEDLGKAVSCDAGPGFLACLRSKTPEELVTALKNPHPPSGGLLNGSVATAVWLPVVDGVGIPEQAADALAKGAVAKVPFLLGTNHDEGALFHAGLITDIPLVTVADYDAALTRTYGAAAPMIHARYPEASYTSLNDALAHVTTDSIFTCPGRRLARAAVKTGVPVFRYQFDATPASGLLSGLGPCHAAELPFVFGTKDTTIGNAGEQGQPLVQAMMSYWSTFARTGDPNGGGFPTWPAYDAATDPYLALDLPPASAMGLLTDVCDFWDTLPPITPAKTY